MERSEALAFLVSESPVDRLRAARALRHVADESDRHAIETALNAESDAWVRSALSMIVSLDLEERASTCPSVEQLVEDPAQLAQDVKAQTTQELTAMISHELAPILGSLRQAAADEVPDFEESHTFRGIEGVASLLGALRSLHKASGVPSVSDFSLSDLVLEVTNVALDEREGRDATALKVKHARSDHVSVSGDRDLLRLVFLNILRNALEASDPTHGGSGGPVVVNWGVTDRDAWIAVIDRGVGLPDGSSRMTEPGVTSKEKGLHLGMGLAVAAIALENMNGTLSHRPREGGGVVAEMRWTAADTEYANSSD